MSKIKTIIHSPYQGYKTLVRWYGRLPVILSFLVTFICMVVIIHNAINNTPADTNRTEVQAIEVTLATPRDYSAGFSGTLIGNTVAKTEATLLTERGGQVTRVPVSLGQSVSAGTVLAEFENASERAALTQAQGAYQSALASAKQSAISITAAENALLDAKRDLINTHNNAQATLTSIIAASIDVFFSKPNNLIFGLKINGYSQTDDLINLRSTLQTQLQEWQNNTTSLNINSDTRNEIGHAQDTLKNTIMMVDIFIAIFKQERGDSQYSLDNYREFVSSFTNIRTTLNGLMNSLSASQSRVVAAQENLDKAKLGGGNESSLAAAQVTQARGSLQAAEANYNKTIIRTPITGTIASLNVRSGDYVGPQSLVAKVTNTDGVEITTFISESERDYFSIGDQLLVDNIATGTISAISPTINPNTRKIEVRVAVSDKIINPGSTVSLSLPNTNSELTIQNQEISIPISAIKFTNNDGVVFIVENGHLISRPVTLGKVSGTTVTIVEGLDYDTEFVIDARGKNEGDQVTLKQ